MQLGYIVQSNIGEKQLDKTGSAAGAARMNPTNAYGIIPKLMKAYIDNGSDNIWEEIRQRIDNVYVTVGSAMEALDSEVSFSEDIKRLISHGKKLFFKVNLVNLPIIDYQNHGPGLIGVCTPWEFVASVMRWFHDTQGITYHQMYVGEAGTTMSTDAVLASKISGRVITTQAILEGKYGNNYGGWGFYFARKYLAECHDPKHNDDPMSGYNDSLAGRCLAPGKTSDKLLVYDLNKVDDTNSRDIPVADGINFKVITMHKAIVGGDPNDPQDLHDWPGAVLINLPKLKVHNGELFTGAVKNIGMGLYPMEANTSREPGKYQWKYAIPNLKIPLTKSRVPHVRWSLEIDEDTCLPNRDKNGNYAWKRTGGIDASISDTIRAVKGQNIMMLHVMDAIETTNIHHAGPPALPVPEGFVFASADPVALDECCSRYLFNMVSLADADEIRKKHKLNSDVIQKIPMPWLEGNNIITGTGYDSSFSRYHLLRYCEESGLGQRLFHIVGTDLWQGGHLASLSQHLGRVNGGVFTELITGTMYYTPSKPMWDLQAAIFAYLELNDKLTGSDYTRQVLETFDENGDGVIDYQEKGRGGPGSPKVNYENSLTNQKIEPTVALKLRFLLVALQFKLSRKEWNTEGHNFGQPMILVNSLKRAMDMSQAKEERHDPLFPGRTWGNGKWPSLQYALQLQLFSQVYGQMFPDRFDMAAPYGQAFNYAEIKSKRARYCDAQALKLNEDIIGKYHKAVANGEALLPFTLYVPRGLGSYNHVRIPNVEETDDPNLILTVSFNGEEVWRDLRISDFHLE